MSILRRPSVVDSSGDQGVSAVIGVILMVAITVAIAATVYIWAGGFGETGAGPESASATARVVSLDSNSDKEWIKVTLTSGGENTPYAGSDVGVQVAAGSSAYDTLCDSPGFDSTKVGSGDPGCADPFASSDSWEVGSAKWFPCKTTDRHSLTVSVESTAILDRTVKCEEVET